MIIDFHTNVGDGMHHKCDINELIKDMDKNHIEKAVICPVDQYLAVRNHEGNLNIAGCVEKFPDRLIGFGTVSPWYGKDSIVEVDKIAELGLRGLKLHPFYQGFLLNDEMIDPIIKKCEEYGLCVLFHTGTPVSSTPFQLRDLAERFEKVRFVMGHMGWSDFWYDVVQSVKGRDNIYLETSYQLYSVIQNCISQIGSDNILFGSDWPYSDIGIEKNKILSLDRKDIIDKILCSNAKALLDL